MRTKMVLILGLLCILSSPVLANGLPPDLTSNEYRALLEQYLANRTSEGKVASTKFLRQVEPAVETGARLLAWIDVINGARPAEGKLSVSSPGSQPAYPISSPRIYNDQIVNDRYAKIISETPAWMTEVILNKNTELPSTAPVTDEEFIGAAIPVLSIYDLATRWVLMEESLVELAEGAGGDVRGFYYLTQQSNLVDLLLHWSDNPEDKKAELKKSLISLCANSGEEKNVCTAIFTSMTPDMFYTRYIGKAAEHWNDHFRIQARRVDTSWQKAGGKEKLLVPFIKPERLDIQKFLSVNIEDEWRFGDWQLGLTFVSSGKHARVEFKEKTIPHVNKLAGNVITMDGSSPLTEYVVQWTIRHEFGHILGFPDCYLEFFDADIGAIVNYQMDTSNLMCSRRGHLQDLHYQEMKRVYGK